MMDLILMMMALFAASGTVDGPQLPPIKPNSPDPGLPSP
jgi:hypothetical protein